MLMLMLMVMVTDLKHLHEAIGGGKTFDDIILDDIQILNLRANDRRRREKKKNNSSDNSTHNTNK